MLSFDEIEDCFPEGGHTDNMTGKMCVSAQWLHDFAYLIAAKERERCRQAVRYTKDKSGVNADGQSWLTRAGRDDFIAAIDAL
jgi:hypothetical protein